MDGSHPTIHSFHQQMETSTGKRQRLIRSGASNVTVQIWLKWLCGIYDAYQVARELEYCDNCSNSRKRLVNHSDEYLVHGVISTDKYGMLAVFDGQEEEKMLNYARLGFFEEE